MAKHVYIKRAGALYERGRGAVTPPDPPGEKLNAIHIPNVCQFGMKMPEGANSNNTWDDQKTDTRLLGPAAFAHVKSNRKFISGWVVSGGSVSPVFNTMWNFAETEDVWVHISAKAPSNDWAGVAAGTYDDDLQDLYDAIVARANGGNFRPFLFTVHHEPAGDGNYTAWANMQIHLSNFFADISDLVVIAPVGNGFMFGRQSANAADIAALYPQTLIDTLNANNHMLFVDCYDTDSDTLLEYTRNRTSIQVQGFVDWCRQHGVKSAGFGEWGVHDADCMQRCWDIMKASTDVLHLVQYYNSSANIKSPWWLVPNGWPKDPSSSDPENRAGDALSAERLARMKLILPETEFEYIDGVQQ